MDQNRALSFPSMVLVILGLLQPIFCLPEENKKLPNIVFIVADDYGHRDIGYHGAEFPTPTLDKLAGEGLKLENYYVQPICTPTRGQLMTGRYQIHTGLVHSIIWPSQAYGLPYDHPSMADVVKGQGYSTHAIGKWHIGSSKLAYTPLYRGFDSFYGYWEGNFDYYTHLNCDGTRKDDDSDNLGIGLDYCGFDFREDNKPIVDHSATYSTHKYTRRAIERIKEAAESDKPLFMYLAYQAPHGPLQAPDYYINKVKYIKNEDRRIYAAMVTALDEGIKNVTEALKHHGLWEDTILIFTTDNGGLPQTGGYNWPLRGMKHTLFEGGMRGVGFVHSPLLKPEQKGNVSTELMHVTDWYPTLADIVGAKLNDTSFLDGHSQWAMIRDGAASPREEILHEIDILYAKKGDKMKNSTFDNRVRAAIRVGPYKLITGDPGASGWYPVPVNETKEIPEISSNDAKKKNIWLFNVVDDPNEKIDLSDSMPDLVITLLRRLSQYNATAVKPIYPGSDPRCDPKFYGNFWTAWEDEPMQ